MSPLEFVGRPGDVFFIPHIGQIAIIGVDNVIGWLLPYPGGRPDHAARVALREYPRSVPYVEQAIRRFEDSFAVNGKWPWEM